MDWMSVLAVANAALVTPQIYSAVLRAGRGSELPDEVRRYLHEIWRRNRRRNARLFRTLRDAVAVLNAAGVEPTLLKGAAYWTSLGQPSRFDRMLNDLDLLVDPEQTQAAITALEAAGFEVHGRYAGATVHVVAELARPHDVGFVDLHQRPPGPPGMAEAALSACGQTRSVQWDGLRMIVPTPAAQILLLVLHDQFHEGGYWRGGFALRHLLDIAVLSRAPAGVDWDALLSLPSTKLQRNALDAQLLAAAATCGAVIPDAARRPWARLQHARQRAQFAWPWAGLALGALAVASETPNVLAHRRMDAADYARMFGERVRHRAAGRVLRRAAEFLRQPNPGRI